MAVKNESNQMVLFLNLFNLRFVYMSTNTNKYTLVGLATRPGRDGWGFLVPGLVGGTYPHTRPVPAIWAGLTNSISEREQDL